MRVILLSLLAALSACQPTPPIATAYEQLLLDDCRAYLRSKTKAEISPAHSVTPQGDLLVVRLGSWTDASSPAIASCSYHRTEHRRVAAVTIEAIGDETYALTRHTNRPPTEGS